MLFEKPKKELIMETNKKLKMGYKKSEML